MSNFESSNNTSSVVKDFDINLLIKTYVKPAVGCTEPAAIALAVSTSFYAASGKVPKFITEERKLSQNLDLTVKTIDEIVSIDLTLDTNVLKNALYVAIPGTNHHHGVDLSAILGLFSTPDRELSIFESIDDDPESLLNVIQEMGIKQKVVVRKREITGIYIHSCIKFNDGTTAEALIRGSHSNIVSIKLNGQNLIKESAFSESEDITLSEIKELNISDMIDKVENELSEESKKLIWEGIEMNMTVARLGLEKVFGDGIGYAHKQMALLKDSTIDEIIANVAAATDVRMAGYSIPVMSNVGSGNQGLIVTVSLTVLAENLLNKPLKDFLSEEKRILINSITLATEITAYTTAYTGMLSNLCGCLCKAGVGAAAGMGYFLYYFDQEARKRNIDLNQVVLNSMKNMIASSCGVLCDGAKGSCANKSKSAGFNAYTSAKEATMNVVGTGGIPGNENTGIKTIMKNFVETYIEKFGQPTDLHIVNYLLTSSC